MLLIFRRETGEVVENTGTNSFYPEGPPAQFFPQYADSNRFGFLRLHDDDDAQQVQSVFTRDVTVVDGELVLGDLLPAPTPPPNPQDLASRLARTEAVLDLLLLGGLDDHGGTLDDTIGDDLPDTGGTLDDLEGLDLTPLPDSGESLDDLDLASLEG